MNSSENCSMAVLVARKTMVSASIWFKYLGKLANPTAYVMYPVPLTTQVPIYSLPSYNVCTPAFWHYMITGRGGARFTHHVFDNRPRGWTALSFRTPLPTNDEQKV